MRPSRILLCGAVLALGGHAGAATVAAAPPAVCIDPPKSQPSDAQVTACDAAIKAAPASDPAALEKLLLARARALNDLERHAAAEKDADAALKLFPADPDALVVRGEARSFAEKNDLAMADFDAALKLKPGHARALMRRGQIYEYNRNDPARALADYDAAIKADPTLMLGWFFRGKLNSDQGRKEAALADFAQASKLAPDEGFVSRALGAALEELDRRPEAIKIYDAVLKAHPDDAETLTYRASARLEATDYGGAAADADLAIAKRDDLPRAFWIKAEALEKQERHAEAISEAEEALKRGRLDAPGLGELGVWYLRAEKLPIALATLDAAVKTDGTKADYLTDRANVYSKLGDVEKADADYDAAIKLEPTSTYARNERGRARLRSGAYQAALDDFEATLKLDPKYDAALYNRALAFENLGQYDRAIAEFNGYLVAFPNDADALDEKANCYRLLGDDLLAIQYAEAAIKQNARLASAWWVLSRARSDSGDAKGGAAAKAQAVKLDPHIAD